MPIQNYLNKYACPIIIFGLFIFILINLDFQSVNKTEDRINKYRVVLECTLKSLGAQIFRMPRSLGAQKPRCPDAKMPRSPGAQKPRCPDVQQSRTILYLRYQSETTRQKVYLESLVGKPVPKIDSESNGQIQSKSIQHAQSLSPSHSQTSPFHSNPNNKNPNLPYLLFYKTHKTGSTTIKNMLFRMAIKYDYPVAWPKARMASSLGYPGRYNVKFLKPKLGTSKILTHHIAYNDEILKIFPEDFDEVDTSEFVIKKILQNSGSENSHPKNLPNQKTRKKLYQFTIIREPFGLMKSTFNYIYPEGQLGLCLRTAKTLKNYLNNYHNTTWSNLGSPIFCKNSIAYDLGFSASLSEEKDLENMIKDLDERMDLVLILEKYYESLILLKEDLGLEFDDIVAFYQNRALMRDQLIDISKEEVPIFREKARNAIKADTLIYDHFLNILNKKIENFGVERMEKEVAYLKQLSKEREEECGIYELKPDSSNGGFSSSMRREYDIPRVLIPYHPHDVSVTTLMIKGDV